MPTATEKKTGWGLLISAAQDALERSGHDRRKAYALLWEWVMTREDLQDEILEAFLDQGCKQAINQAIAVSRQKSWNHNHKQDDPRGLEDLARFNLSLYDFQLPNSDKLLGDATKDDLLKAVGFYRLRETSYRERADWLEAVAEKMPDAGTVRKKISEKELKQLREWAQK